MFVKFVNVIAMKELIRAFKKILHTTSFKIKVVEKTGRTVNSVLCKSYSFDKITCQINFAVCSTNQHVSCKN